MHTMTIGSKNQIVIPKEIRKKITGLKPGRKVVVYPTSDTTIAIKVEPTSWIESAGGSMKNAWKNIDPIKELEKLRSEW